MSIYDQNVQLKNCALELFVGSLIAEGSFRRVYELQNDDQHVLKIQFDRGHHNMMEWEIWKAAKDTKWAKWFAPCTKIDSWGSAMLMRRATTFENQTEFLAAIKRVPSFFDDVKWTNWGMIDGRPVCIDYGHNHLLRMGLEPGSALKPTKPLKHT